VAEGECGECEHAGSTEARQCIWGEIKRVAAGPAFRSQKKADGTCAHYVEMRMCEKLQRGMW
jgi:hypothetical protein